MLEECLIPAETEPVEVHLYLQDGSGISPLRQGDGGIRNCSINGIPGILTIEQESYISTEFKYYFTRLEPGEACLVESGTYLINEGSYLYNDCIPVIFIGQNGSWESPQDLIDQQQKLLDTLDNPNKYIIVGLTSGTEEERRELEEMMETHWGKHYVNLRNYLCRHGLDEAGITPTQIDLEQMEKGMVPDSLRVDAVHFNKDGYTLIGTYIFKRLSELHYIP